MIIIIDDVIPKELNDLLSTPLPKGLAIRISSEVQPIVENGYLQFFFNLTLLENGNPIFQMPKQVTKLPSYLDNGTEMQIYI